MSCPHRLKFIITVPDVRGTAMDGTTTHTNDIAEYIRNAVRQYQHIECGHDPELCPLFSKNQLKNIHVKRLK